MDAVRSDSNVTKYKTLPTVPPKGGEDSVDGSTNRLRMVTRLVTVEPAIIVYNVAFNASTPLQIQYINYRIGQDIGLNTSVNVTGNSTDQCGASSAQEQSQQAAIQAAAATYLTIMTMSSIIPCLITTLPIGSYSDKAGRKYGLVPPLFGEIIRIFLCVLITAFKLPIWLFCLGLFAQGIMGGVGSFLMTCYSYMADVTSPSNRGFRIFIVELCMGIGQIVAQVAMGEAIENFGYMYPFLVILALQILNMGYILFILPETLYKMPNATLFSCDNYKRSFTLYFDSAMRGKRLFLGLGLGVMATVAAANMVNNETITLYLVNRPLCWNPILVGYYMALAIAVKYFCSLVLLRVLKGRLPEAVLAMGSLISNAAYDVVVGLATQTWTIFLAPLAGFTAQIADPMVRSITSKLVSVEKQGALFASHAWVSMVSSMLGTVFFNAIYGASSTFPGLVFIIAAVLYTIPFLLALILHFRLRKSTQMEEKQYSAAERQPLAGATDETDSS